MRNLQGEDAKNNTLMISLKTGLQLTEYFGILKNFFSQIKIILITKTS